MKKIFILALMASSPVMAVQAPTAVEHFSDNQNKLVSDLVKIPSDAASLDDLFKNMVSFFVQNEDALAVLDKKVMWRFLVPFAHRWSYDKYYSFLIFLAPSEHFFKTEREVKIIQKIKKLFKQCYQEYRAFEEAVTKQDLVSVTHYLEKGIPYENIIGHFLSRRDPDIEAKRKFLQNAGIDKDLIDSIVVSHELNGAIYDDNNPKVEEIIKTGFDLNKITVYDVTPLGFASYHGKCPAIELLVASGADINHEIDGRGKTALIIAVDSRHIKSNEHILLLIKLGADLNKKDKDGYTALMHAWQQGNLLAFQTLIDAGADIRVKNNQGRTILESVKCYVKNLGDKDHSNAVYIDLLLEKAAASR